MFIDIILTENHFFNKIPALIIKIMAKQLNVKPLGDRAVIAPIKEAGKTKSGIILPETVDKEKPAQGRIVALGTGEKIKKSGIKKGNEVIFEKYAGTEFKIGDIEYKILKEEEILAILE